MGKQVKLAIAGLGNRGNDIYAHYEKEYPDEMKVVAIAEPVNEKREQAKADYQVADAQCFVTAEEMLEQPKMADAVVIATQDKQHVKEAVRAIEQGYHVLVEKPISPSIEECLLLKEKAHEYHKIVSVGHVLRYAPFYVKIKELIQSGRIGEVQHIQAMEKVCYWHQAHSFVRGNWRNSEETSPMILAKCCHDFDIFIWLLGKKCLRLSSFGERSLFRADQAPQGAPKRCLDGCPVKDQCPYDAEKIYITNEATGIRKMIRENHTGDEAWPVCVLSPTNLTEEAIYEQLRTGPYGRCVYACDNDVVDHQSVNMEFEDHVTVDFTMTAFTAKGGRPIRICGTKGEIFGDLAENQVTVAEFGKPEEVFDVTNGDMSGHSGGDNRLIRDFLNAISGDVKEEDLKTGIDVSIQSHIIAVAAEYSRVHGGKVVDLSTFIEEKEYANE